MTASEFKTLVTMLSRLDERLTEQIDSLSSGLGAEMLAGFARQEALSHEILKITGEYISDLESRFEKTRKEHKKRLHLLEKRAA